MKMTHYGSSKEVGWGVRGGDEGDMDLFGIRGKMAVDQFIRFRHRIKIAAQLPLFAEFSFFSKLSLEKTVLGVLKKGSPRRFCV